MAALQRGLLRSPVTVAPPCWWAAAFACALLSGCAEKAVEDSDDAPPLALDDTAECNLHVPVVTGVTISNGGIETFDNGDFPTVGVTMDVTDDDGDLDLIGMNIWIDTVVDGAVDRSGPAVFDVEAFLFQGAEECGKFGATLTLEPAVTSNVLDFNTRYEFAVTAIDHHGVESSPYIADGVTPDSDGTDGTAP